MLACDSDCFFQWDTGRVVRLADEPNAESVHMAMRGDRRAMVVPVEQDGDEAFAKVPDVLLQRSGWLVCLAFDGEAVTSALSVGVVANPKPEGYAATPAECVTIEALRAWVVDYVGEHWANLPCATDEDIDEMVSE